MKTQTTFLCSILFFLSTIITFGQSDTRYVSPNGSNSSNDCTDPSNPCGTIQYAINEASDGATIEIDNGVYTEPLLLISKSITLDGADDTPSGTVIQAAETPGSINARVIWVLGSHNVSIKDLIIRNGKASGTGLAGYGGGIRIDDGGLSIENVKIEDNIAGDFGGGVYLGPTVNATFTNVFVRDNTTETSGAGIYMDNGAVGILSNVVIERNIAEGSGGGIYMSTNSLGTFSGNVRIRNNQADNSGGGITMNQSGGSFNNVTIQDNMTSGVGGGLRINESSPSFEDVVITSNISGSRGGGIYNTNGSPQFNDVEFNQNYSETSGGGMYHTSGGHAVLNTVTFFENQADEDGGGMVCNNASAEFKDVEFNQNTAHDMEGGGLWNNHDDTILEDVLFFENTAGFVGGHGGGMFNRGSSALKNTIFQGNVVFSSEQFSATGGGMYNIGSSSNPTLTNVAFFDNVASVSDAPNSGGGGLLNYGGFITLINSTITGNYAGSSLNNDCYGGGISNVNGGRIHFVNSIIWGNTAEGEGNEIYINFSITNLYYSLYDNQEGDIVLKSSSSEFNPDEHSIVANPLFVDAVNGDLHLQELSPAIDAGRPDIDPDLFPGGPENPVDIEGNPRFSNGRIDIGAYEYQFPTSVEFTDEVPSDFILNQNYPNPFNPQTTITFSLPKDDFVTLKVYNALGEEAAILINEFKGAGTYEVNFNGNELSSGVYFYKLEAGNFNSIRKMILLK